MRVWVVLGVLSVGPGGRGASAAAPEGICPALQMAGAVDSGLHPEAAPGLRIPSGNIPWALDVFEGRKELVPMHASAVQVNTHRGSNVVGGLAAGPFYKSKMTTELAGVTARTAVHTATPVFYFHLDEQATADTAGTSMIAGWAVVHAGVDSGRRLLSTVKFTQLTGNAKRSDGQVEVTIEVLPHGWMRVTPKGAMAPGEYALLPVMRQANAFSTAVYDFRVDPAAENATDAVEPAP